MRYFADQLAGELGQEPSVQTVAKLVSTVRESADRGLSAREQWTTIVLLHCTLAAALLESVASPLRSTYTQTLPNTQHLHKKQMNYQNKEMLMGAMIVAGYDAQRGGQVYGVPIGGSLVREQWAVDGSGSTYIWAALDDGFREGMTREEAERLVVDALSLAMTRDASSGGVIRTVTLDKSGASVRYIGGSDVPAWFEDLPAPAAGGSSSAAAAAMAVG